MTAPEARADVTLRGMRFHARVGILPHERELPQPIEVDVTATVAGDRVLDYRMLYDDACAVMRDDPIEHLEDICRAIADRALAHAGVARVRVTVRKPHVALPGPLAHAEVSVVRERRAQ